ncbi:unnamed protein product [Cyclocybe aegerita]|uniref:BZIP domain-containing protein n=1 Tax=Cyclocybe aegerita TaxID=1973307 RepID=A0A8S0XMK0_CYCAE|nr:unnamed protein product [Cyclocybe aegerita]
MSSSSLPPSLDASSASPTSSKNSGRGRKPDNNSAPKRSRDVQRAFRARRAAYLQGLEQRLHELEQENDHLRRALNICPAARVPLGTGPTGLDRHRAWDSNGFPIRSGSSIPESADQQHPPHQQQQYPLMTNISAFMHAMPVNCPLYWQLSMGTTLVNRTNQSTCLLKLHTWLLYTPQTQRALVTQAKCAAGHATSLSATAVSQLT